MALTTLSNLVDPQVMADMISATLTKKIKFKPIAQIDTTLSNRPGDTITVPKYGYIGEAVDVPEGTAISTSQMSTSTTQVTVKKAGKAVEISDESKLSGYGNPTDEAVKQLQMSIVDKVDHDCYDKLCTCSTVYDGTAANIAYNGLVMANALFSDESDNALQKVMFIHPDQEKTILTDSNFMDMNKYPMPVIMTGQVGAIAGANVVKSKRVKKVIYSKDNSAGTITIVVDATAEDATHVHLSTALNGTLNTVLVVGDKLAVLATPYYANPIVVLDVEDPDTDPAADPFSTTQKALTIYMKRDVIVEADRDVLKKTDVYSVDEHYVVALSNDSKVVLAKFKA